MKTFKQSGEVLPVIAPYDVQRGSGVLIGQLFGLACATVNAGRSVDIMCKGEFVVDKVTTEAWAVGDKIYWNSSSKKFSNVGGVGLLVGLASESAVNPSLLGSLLLTQQPGLVDPVFNAVTRQVSSIAGILEKVGGAAPNLILGFTDSLVLNPANGVASTSAGWKSTDYMPVSPLTPYSASKARFICWYNSSQAKIGTSVDQSTAAWSGASPTAAAFARLTVSQGEANVTFFGPTPAQSILTVEGEQLTTLNTMIKAWFINSTFIPIGTITRNAGGKITTPQIIKWPDGAVGNLLITYNGDWTVSTASATYTGAGGYAITVTQPAITYDGSGNATLIPELLVA